MAVGVTLTNNTTHTLYYYDSGWTEGWQSLTPNESIEKNTDLSGTIKYGFTEKWSSFTVNDTEYTTYEYDSDYEIYYITLTYTTLDSETLAANSVTMVSEGDTITKFNGTSVTSVNFNGTSLTKLVLNGTTVFENS